MPVQETPLFPLNTVLFPGGVLPLRIFESRYVDMVSRCMREGGEFGVLLIESGREAGGSVTYRSVGTLARIVDFDQLPNKMLGIAARGTQRFRTLATRVQSDGLHVAEIDRLPPEASIPLPKEFARYARLLEEALPQMGDFFRYLEPQYGDTAWVCGRLAEILPIAMLEKQRVLELDDPLARMEILQPLMRADAGKSAD